MEHYLSLTDYAAKYKISISTLRRKIRKSELPYKLDQGRYMLLDQAPPKAQGWHRPSQASGDMESVSHAPASALGFSAELLQLKKEVIDLKMLVSVLEDELVKLKAQLPLRRSLDESETTADLSFPPAYSERL
ncbi:MAG: hypothetical protein N2Z70_03890 [Bdellovibrionaceae bacterium]|jgi:hypothetical protein|nr:hypothetical protein [Pseudobdellovibrionaceae bacterium]